MPSDKPGSQSDVFTKAANGETAGSYTTDGRWNRGGWWTYPSADALAISTTVRQSQTDQSTARR